MSLITRIGAPNANSFVTLDQADRILETLPDSVASWNALTNQEKEYRLILAALIIAKLPLRGRRVYKKQAMPFPRVLYDLDEEEWPDETACRRIPDEIREAQCQIAYSTVHRALVNRGAVTEAISSSVSSVSLGGALSVSFGSQAGGTQGNLLDLIMGSVSAPIYLKLQKWISQIRGMAIRSIDDDDYFEPCDTLPTTTTTSSTSTTTSSSTTTTTTAP